MSVAGWDRPAWVVTYARFASETLVATVGATVFMWLVLDALGLVRPSGVGLLAYAIAVLVAGRHEHLHGGRSWAGAVIASWLAYVVVAVGLIGLLALLPLMRDWYPYIWR